MWDAQISALAAQHRVIAPDLRGFGRSEVTDGTVTMEQFADDLAGLLDALGVAEPVVYCGLSMGGYIGWQFYRKYASRLRGMILCDTRAIADSPAVILCQYDRRRFPGSQIVTALLTHPIVILGYNVARNPYFVPAPADAVGPQDIV
jgi:pimeloyl-ACP methyl ester carboxylesterase